MLYELRQGPNEAEIVEQARRLSMPLPDKIRNKPRLRYGLDLYWKAFADLSSDRMMGMTEGPISWRSIHAWGERNCILGDDFERLVSIVRTMDETYLKFRSSESKDKSITKDVRP